MGDVSTLDSFDKKILELMQSNCRLASEVIAEPSRPVCFCSTAKIKAFKGRGSNSSRNRCHQVRAFVAPNDVYCGY